MAISNIANFDLLNSFDFVTYIFGSYAFNHKTRDPYEERFRDLYSSCNIIENMGTNGFIIFFLLILKLISYYVRLINRWTKKKFKVIIWVSKKLKTYLGWPLIIRVFLQSHFQLLYSSLLNLLVAGIA